MAGAIGKERDLSVRRALSKGLGIRSEIDLEEPLTGVTWEQIRQIDEALATVGPFGEVWLLKRDGVLRAIRKLDVVAAAHPAIFALEEATSRGNET